MRQKWLLVIAAITGGAFLVASSIYYPSALPVENSESGQREDLEAVMNTVRYVDSRSSSRR